MARYKEYGYDIKDGVGIIPEWEMEIKEWAFIGCKELKRIDIPQWVTKIGKDAFYGCENLTEIVLPEWLEEIGDNAFSGCSFLEEISLPRWVKKIGNRVFSGCSSLTSIVVSKENQVYDSREDCNAIIQTESNTLIIGCVNTTFPPSVTEIGGSAFYGCSSLTSISIPPSVTKIGYWAFYGCSSLTSIVVSKDNKVYDSREDCNAIIHTKSNTLICGCKNTIISPTVKKIGDSAFGDCSSLANISIPPSVTEIGVWAFHGCSSLTSISIPPSVTKIGDEVFYNCDKLCDTVIPPSVTSLGENVFGCDNDSSYNDEYDYDYDNPSYGRYAGSYAQDVEGWSDNDIDDVFDGDPDAYWNID